MTKGTTSTLLLACFAVAAGAAACKRPNVGYALSPWDAASITNCEAHGPLARTCNECNGGDVQACLTLARQYEARHDLGRAKHDLHVAASFYGRACEHNYIPACVLLADHYSVVRFEPTAREDSLKVRDDSCAEAAKACASKDALACRIEGMCLAEDWQARKAPPDVPGALRAFASACDLGDARGCARLGWLRAAGSQGADDPALAEALAAYQKACDLELAEGCVAVAGYLQYGLGAPADLARARSLTSEWCARGSVEACHAESGHYRALWSLLAHDAAKSSWTPPDAARLAGLDLQANWAQALGRTGFCVNPDGAVDQVTTLDSVGDPAVDQVLRETVSGWKFPRRPSAPICLSHEHNFVFAVRPWLFRARYIVTDQWVTAGGGVTMLDHNWQLPARAR
jgi:TPR repeat protein